MGRYEVKNPLTPEGRNQINSMFEELYKEYIGAGNNAKEAREKAVQAVADSILAKDIAETTRQEMLAIIREQTKNGDLAPEIAQARGKAKTLGERFNSVDSQLAQADEYRRTETPISRKRKREPMITIVDDDGQVEFYTIMFKLAKEFNIPITSAMITSFVEFPDFPKEVPWKGYYTYEQIKEMRDSGYIEFIGHSHGNINAKNSTEQEVRSDLAKCHKILKTYGLNHRTMAFPFGAYDEKSLQIAKEFFDYGIGSATSVDDGKRIVTPPVNNYRLGRYSGDGTNSIENIAEMMDKTIEQNGWLILTTHIMQNNNGTDENHIRNIITRAIAKGMKFVKVEEGVQAHGNIMQFGGTNMNPAVTVSADGKIYGDRLGRVIHDNSREINGNTPIDYFEPMTTTNSIIRRVQTDGLPTARSGMLITHRTYEDDPVYNYQLFITTRSKEFWVRFWDFENEPEGWSKWVNFSPNQYLGINAVTSNTTLKDSRLARKETITIINRQGNEGFPENQSGVLKTIGFETDGFAYQEYDLYQENKKYKRNWNESQNKWGRWNLVQSEVLVQLEKTYGFDSNKLAEAYPIGTTINVINNQTSVGTGLPDEQTGTVITEKTANEDVGRYAYQTFKVNGAYLEYKRFVKNDGQWSEWLENRPTFYERGFNVNKRAKDYQLGTTYSVVNLGDDRTGLPNEATGTIITEKTAEGHLGRYAYQTFKVNGEPDEYVRKLKTDGTWGSWYSYDLTEV